MASTFHDAFNQTFGNMLRMADIQQQRANESRRLDQAEKGAAADEKYRADDLALRRDQLASTERNRAASRTLALRQEDRLQRADDAEQAKLQREERARRTKQRYTEVQTLLDSGRPAEAASKAKKYGITTQLDDLVEVGNAARVLGNAFATGDPRALSTPDVQVAQSRIGEALLRNSGRGDKYTNPQFLRTNDFLSGLPDGPRKQALQQAIEQKFGREGGVLMTFEDKNGRRFTATEMQSSDPNDPVRVQSWDDIHGALQTWATSGEQARQVRDQLAAGLAGARAYLGETESKKDPFTYRTTKNAEGNEITEVWYRGQMVNASPGRLDRDDGSSYMKDLGIAPGDAQADAAARDVVTATVASLDAPEARAAVFDGQSEADWALAAREGKLPTGEKIETPNGMAWENLQPYQQRRVAAEAYGLYVAETALDRLYKPVLDEALKGTDLTYGAAKKWVLMQAKASGDGDISGAVDALLKNPEQIVRHVKAERDKKMQRSTEALLNSPLSAM